MPFSSLLNLLCTISSKETSKDSAGFVSSDYNNVKHTNIPCRLHQVRSDEAFALQNIYPNARWWITVQANITDIKLEDQVTINSTNYYVHAIKPVYRVKRIHHYRFLCSEVTP